jgi:hypothetical protein
MRKCNQKGGRQGEKKGWRGGRCSLDTLDTCRLVGSKVPLVDYKLQTGVCGRKEKQAKKNNKRMSE